MVLYDYMYYINRYYFYRYAHVLLSASFLLSVLIIITLQITVLRLIYYNIINNWYILLLALSSFFLSSLPSFRPALVGVRPVHRSECARDEEEDVPLSLSLFPPPRTTRELALSLTHPLSSATVCRGAFARCPTCFARPVLPPGPGPTTWTRTPWASAYRPGSLEC